MTGDEAERIERLERLRALEVAKQTGRKPWAPEPHQVPPPKPWYLWLMVAGRMAGKTDAGASYFDRFMRRNPGARGGIIGPTLGDTAEACVYGPSGLMAHNPLVRVRTRAGGTFVLWPNGSEAKLFGAYTKEDVERLRAGGNRHLFWCDEIAAWRYLKETWENMELGLRLGPDPHIVATTTPKPRPKLRELMDAPDTALTRATMHDNPHIVDLQKQRLIGRYAGTRLEAQEILGQYLDQVEGALWTFETIALHRVVEKDVPDLARVVVAVDPSGGDEDGNDEQGIVVAGRGVDGHGYVLADRSCKLSPDGWGRRAVQAFIDHRASKVIGETNYGGDLVLANVKVAARAMGATVVTSKITASRGKVARAEPVAALYEQGKVHHVGEFPELESQMRNWSSDSGWSPDRMDALVWALTDLMVTSPSGLARGGNPNRTGRRVPTSIPGR